MVKTEISENIFTVGLCDDEGYVHDMLDEMLILYEQGQSYTGIATKLEISYPTVKKYIEIAREYGFFDRK